MKYTVIAAGLILSGLIHGCKQEVSQWRGPDRNGVFPEIGLLEEWPESGPELLWIYEGIGRGFAAPAISNNRVFVNGEQEGSSYLFALDIDGNLLWKSPNGKEFLGEGFSSTYPGARSTPTVIGKLVYTSSGDGRIACYETSDGEERWAVHIVNDLGGALGEFGYSESVAVDKDLLYCFPGGADTNLAALDRFTGRTAWSSEVLSDTFAYGSPVLVDLPDLPVLITTSRHHLFSVERESGKLLGAYTLEGYEYDGEHCNTLVYADGQVYFVGNDEKGQGAVKLELSRDGQRFKEIWRNDKIKNNFGGLVIVNGHLFTTVKGNWLVSLDPETGTVTDSLKVDGGSVIFADNKFICYGNNGTVNLVSHENGELAIRGEMKILEGNGHHFAHPVVADGVLYIRHGNALMAYRIKPS